MLISLLAPKSIIFDFISAILLRLILLSLYASSGALRNFLYALPLCITDLKFNCIFSVIGLFFILSEILISLCMHFARSKVYAKFSLSSVFSICVLSILVSFTISFFLHLDEFSPNYSSIQAIFLSSIIDLILLIFGGYIGLYRM
jgi:hypothetical protein